MYSSSSSSQYVVCTTYWPISFNIEPNKALIILPIVALLAKKLSKRAMQASDCMLARRFLSLILIIPINKRWTQFFTNNNNLFYRISILTLTNDNVIMSAISRNYQSSIFLLTHLLNPKPLLCRVLSFPCFSGFVFPFS